MLPAKSTDAAISANAPNIAISASTTESADAAISAGSFLVLSGSPGAGWSNGSGWSNRAAGANRPDGARIKHSR